MVRLTNVTTRRPVRRKREVEERHIPGRARPKPLDRDFSFDRDGHQWTFEEGRVYIEGQDVNEVINETQDLSIWLGVIGGLTDYKTFVLARTRSPSQVMGFCSVADAMLEKLMGKLRKFYDDKLFGLSWKLRRGELIINGININSFLALYEQRKTDKAKRFLLSIRDKLQMILSNRQGNPDYERIRNTVEQLKDRIQEALGEKSSSRSRLLLRGGRSSR